MDIKHTIDGMVQAAQEAIPKNDGDYVGEDGLLICGKCGTPKQTRVEIFGETITPMCLCKCEKERADRRAREERRAALRIGYRQDCFSDMRMEKWNFAHDDGESERIMKIAQNYVNNFEKMRGDGKGLLFFGDVGSGKTFAAACIANAIIDECFSCKMTNFAEIRNTVQATFDGRQKYFDSLMHYDLLIIDDLCAEGKTEFMNEIVYNVIDSRYRSGLPLIITSNLTSEELRNPADLTHKRIFSRLLEMCIPIEVKGKDRRKKILKDTFGEYSDLLEL